MGCNCGKSKPVKSTTTTPPTTQTFSLQTPDRTQTFGSRLEAEAARIRAGGVGQISTV